ncbi:VirB3 family type IV secretion system protein [Palleronia sp.]|uniref:VirB3 family type IV secretion system protein n=1 Tax=Palleronia sp. TaxID=1940284 RepID=UPI0035C87627
MQERTPFYIALTQSSKLFGLPYGFALPFMGGTVLPLIWSVSVYTAVWCILVYGLCRWAAEKDEKVIDVFLTGSRAVPGTRTRKMFGGDSYGA